MMLRSPKLWVNLILNFIGVRLRFIGTHFDHKRYIIRIFIFWFFYRSRWSHAKVSDPLYRGFQNLFFINYHFNLLLVTLQCFRSGEKSEIKIFQFITRLYQYGGARGAECPFDQKKNCQKSGKTGVKSGKKWEKEGKSGRKGKNWEGSFTLPLLTDKAAYGTVAS